MPTLSASNFPPPKSWDEFERIMLDAARLRWSSNSFFLNGRPGDKQDGVDIWGTDMEGRLVAIQCKNSWKEIPLPVIEKEIVKAKSFLPPIDRFYIATTQPRSALLQEQVRKISDGLRSEKLFSVDVLFWDDIQQDLSRDSCVLAAHYPQFFRSSAISERDRKLLTDISGFFNTGCIEFLKETPMTGHFELSRIRGLEIFNRFGTNVENEFANSELESLRTKLSENVSKYLHSIAVNSNSTLDKGFYSVVPPERFQPDLVQYQPIVDLLHRIADEIIEAYNNLVRKGRELSS